MPEELTQTIILPIPSSRNGREVTGTDVSLDTLAAQAAGGMLIAGYGLPYEFRRRAEELGATVADVKDDERFTLENAGLTAECTLSYIMNGSEVSVGEMRLGIVGYGRICRVLLELLLFLGADVSVFTRRESTRLELLFSGVDAVLVPDAELSGFDLLINTAPACLFSKKQCENIDCEVLELAPGDNFPWAKRVTRLPSLPAKMLPKSSGRAYARAVARIIGGRGECK